MKEGVSYSQAIRFAQEALTATAEAHYNTAYTLSRETRQLRTWIMPEETGKNPSKLVSLFDSERLITLGQAMRTRSLIEMIAAIPPDNDISQLSGPQPNGTFVDREENGQVVFVRDGFTAEPAELEELLQERVQLAQEIMVGRVQRR